MTTKTIEQEVVRTEAETFHVCDDCGREVDSDGTALRKTSDFRKGVRHYCSPCWGHLEDEPTPGGFKRASEWARGRYLDRIDLDSEFDIGLIEFVGITFLVCVFMPLLFPVTVLDALGGHEEAKVLLIGGIAALPWGLVLAVAFGLVTFP